MHATVSEVSDAAPKLTSGQRLTRGLAHTAAGPVDVARGVLGLGARSIVGGADQLRRRYRESRLAREVAAAPEAIAREFASVQEVLSGIPDALQQARTSQHRSRRPRVVAAAAVGAAVLLAAGTAAVVIARRSSRPDESPRPPSVDLQPRP